MLHTDVIVPIPDLLQKHSIERPDQIAFRDPMKSVTYSELNARTDRLAGHLLDLGLAPGDRLLMFLDNAVEVAEGYLVAPRAGIVTVSTNPGATRYELQHIVTDSGAAAILTDRDHLTMVLAILEDDAIDTETVTSVIVTGQRIEHAATGAKVVFYDDLIAHEPRSTTPDATDLDTWCWMLYTSGTTGRPKGVHLNQRGCLWVVGACWIPIAGLNATDVMFCALPLFHSYALVLCVLGVASTGATAILLPKFSPTRALSALAEDGVTFFPGVPTMYRYLKDSTQTATLEAPALRLCVSAGALMSTELNQEFEQFSGVPLLDGYGITETSTMVTMNAPTGTRVPGSCGLPLPGLTVRLVDPTTDNDVAPGQEGELRVQGPGLMMGYHNLPEATEDVLQGGWYRTGDLARRDENGFLRISGRIKELIIRGGENIYPSEIEHVLVAHEAVSDAAVVAAPHESLGEVPLAYVVTTRDDVDLDELKLHCASTLSYYKVPVEFVVVSEIPRTGSGKIQRHRLHRPETADQHQ